MFSGNFGQLGDFRQSSGTFGCFRKASVNVNSFRVFSTFSGCIRKASVIVDDFRVSSTFSGYFRVISTFYYILGRLSFLKNFGHFQLI